MIKTHGLTHISLSVADPERSVAFYTRLFGVREYHREEGSIQVKGPGPHDILVFERRAGHGRRGGIDHLGFRLTDPADIDPRRSLGLDLGALGGRARSRLEPSASSGPLR